MQLRINKLFENFDKSRNQKFYHYHKEHPDVYETFKKLTLETINKGFKKFYARGVFQVMRWLKGGKIKAHGFKYNNNYTTYYVRLFERDYPQHEGFFEKRKTNYQI